MTVCVNVDLGAFSYPIFIGATDGFAMPAFWKAARADRYFIVSDENVAPLYLADLKKALGEGTVPDIYIVPPGEASKTMAVYQRICEVFLNRGITRTDAIIALGGGVVGDLAGFVAATILRGVKYIQIPTSLLAQVDSAVGGKTGINAGPGKNLIGAFYLPVAVLADNRVLQTLRRRERIAGYAEILKYALLGDKVFFEWLDDRGGDVLNGDAAAVTHAVETSCRTKADIVAADEREAGVRALLNLGHTFGHALESYAGYNGDLLHGEAVLLGMDMAFAFSVYLGFCPREEYHLLRDHYKKLGLWPDYRMSIKPDEMIARMHHDKKAESGQIILILVKGIGKAYIERTIKTAIVREFLQDYLQQQDKANGI